MKHARVWLCFAAICWSMGLSAQTESTKPTLTQTAPAELASHLPVARLGGRARLSVWGFQVYDATLWTAPGFRANAFENHAFALELAYLRKFKSEEIAKRSLTEMERQRPIPADKAANWERQLLEAIPDVRPGDRITGIYQPGQGARFLVNGAGQRLVPDAEFSRLFFGIWLADTTSEPSMRRELLSQVAP